MPKNHKPKKPIKDLKLDISDEMIAERRGGSEKMPQDMPKWMASTITKIDLFNKWVGNTVCWITIPLILAMTYEVFARKLFNAPTMWAYDMSRFMYGALFMLGAGYALSKGVHIRADFLYRNFQTKNQGRIDFWLYLLFYFPGLIVFFYMTTGFCTGIYNAWRKRYGYCMDAIHVAYKSMFMGWNNFFINPRNF
jgi:TRAP-type mannitol/chloroaromatic compound transport system permease small subunit